MKKLLILCVLVICTSIIFGKNLYSDSMPDMLYSYSSGTAGSFYVYEKLNDDGYYIQFRIYHSIDSNKNCNLWRVLESYIVKYDGSSSMSRTQQVLVSGENEFVWKSNRLNVGDFTGGFHGDERIDIDPTSYVNFYADSILISTSTNIPLTVCTSFSYEQNSTMHQTGTGGTDLNTSSYVPTPGNPVDCFHNKKTVFENKGYTCVNKVIWNTDVPINLCYYGIFCVNKDIAYQGSNLYGATTLFTSDGSNKLSSDKQQITMWNTSLGVSTICDCSIVNLPFVPNLNTVVWDTSNYHKYYSKIYSVNAQKDDVWEMKSTITFNYTVPTTEITSVPNDKRVKITIINNKLQISGLFQNEKFNIYDISGIIVKSGNCNSNTSQQVQAGNIYIIKLELVDGCRMFKIIC